MCHSFRLHRLCISITLFSVHAVSGLLLVCFLKDFVSDSAVVSQMQSSLLLSKCLKH